MYRIMLADDEGIVTDSLSYIIRKNFEDTCEIETAKTGRSVIELAERFKPDIAFMDIQMPGINGIEAIREIKKTNPSVIFVILSAYDKFMYAKEAISLGVMEYLNKPVNQKVVVDVIERAIKQIDAKRERHRNDLIVKERLETVIPIIESGFVSSIMLREQNTEDIENYKQLLELDGEYGYMLAIVFGESQEGVFMTNALGASVKATRFYKTVCDALKERFRCVVGNMVANKVPVFVPCDTKMDYNDRIEVIDQCRELSRMLQKETDIQFRIGVGSVKKMSEAMESYQEAIKSLVSTTARVAHVDDLPVGCEYEENYPIELEKAIFEELNKGEVDRCMDACSQFFDWMIETYGEEDSNVRLKALEFVLFAEQDAYLSGGMVYRFEARRDYLPTVVGVSRNSELRGWFLDKMQEACRNVTVKKGEHTSSIIQKAKEYIDEWYMKDISLDDVSRQMNLSPYYFSKLFKEETGENFIEYLTRLRINKAKLLLADKEKSMKEICAEVGYSDPNYFSRIFKKSVGVTPTEFREAN